MSNNENLEEFIKKGKNKLEELKEKIKLNFKKEEKEEELSLFNPPNNHIYTQSQNDNIQNLNQVETTKVETSEVAKDETFSVQENEVKVEETSDVIEEMEPEVVVKVIKKKPSIFEVFKKKANYTVLEKADVLEILKTEKDIIIIDARKEEKYLESHIKNSINIPLENFKNIYKEYLKDKTQRILIYSDENGDSQKLSAQLAIQGYEKIVDIGELEKYIGVLEIDKNN